MTAVIPIPPSSSTDALIFHALLQLILILLAAWASGLIAQRLGQPKVMGEMVAGILLGPSLFGHIAPRLFHILFESSSPLPLTLLSQIGLILLMFQIGLEFDFGHLRLGQNRRAVTAIWIAGILLPATLGAGLGWVSHAAFSPSVSIGTYVFFIAVSLSITAMPVLGRIILEMNLSRTRIGTLAMTSAAFGDVVGWFLLAAVVALARSETVGATLALHLAGFALFIGVTWFLARPLLLRLARSLARAGDLSHLSLLLGSVFLFALATQQLGIHAIFGGFWFGVLLHTETEFAAWWRERAAGFVTVFFVPIFFAFTGLRADIPGLDSRELWGWCLLVLALATIGKFGGCWIAARWAGLSASESRCVAVMMNTRGLLELVVANVGYELGIIPRTVFTMLVFMALFSTALTVPCLRAWLPVELRPKG